MILEIPFTNVGAQRFVTQLGDAKYQFDARYNERSSCWVIDLSNPVTNELIQASIPLVIGADLIAPFNLGIGKIMVNDEDGIGLDADPDDLGGRVKVYWFSPDEVAP